jgi:chromosome partitioning protein
MYDVLIGDVPLSAAVVETKVPGLAVVPANHDLVGLESEIHADANRPYRLRDAVAKLAANQGIKPGQFAFTYVLIDCPPSLNLLTLNAMTAAQAVLVPVQCEFFALEGISQLKETIDQIKATLNPELEIQGVVLTMHDSRTAFSREVADNVRAFFGAKVYQTMIPRNIRVAEAPSYGKPILLYDPECVGSVAYMKLATEMMARERLAA